MNSELSRRRARALGIVLVVLVAEAAATGMIGVGGLLTVAFQRKGWMGGGGLFLALLGVSAVSTLASLALFRVHRRLVEQVGFEDT